MKLSGLSDVTVYGKSRVKETLKRWLGGKTVTGETIENCVLKRQQPA